MVDMNLVKQYLRISGDDEDGLLECLINVAKDAASEYMKFTITEKISNDVVQGMLLHIAYLYENRPGDGGSVIPEEALRLYQPHRHVRIL